MSKRYYNENSLYNPKINYTDEIQMERLKRCLKTLRKERKWMQKDLAVISGLCEVSISCIERGCKEPTVKTIEKIAKAFDLETWELMLKAEEYGME